MFCVPLIINNEDVLLSNELQYEVYNPQSTKTLHRAQGADVRSVQRAAEAASVAFKSWSRIKPLQRRALFWKAAELLEQRRPQFEKAMIEECSCPPEWAVMQVHVGRELLEELGSLVTQPNGFITQSNEEGCLPMVTYEPLGVCVGMSAWNSPLALGFRAIATPLAAGNTVIKKSSELCPLTHYLIAKVFVDAGFPPGTVNLIHHSKETAPAIVKELVCNRHVRKVNFTGSVEVGRIVGRLAGESLKGVLLELGGKCPEIILEDADLDAAAKAAIHHSFHNNGQICMSTDRIIVVKAVAGKLEKLLLENLSNYALEGTMISETSAKKVEDLVRDAVAKGASVRYRYPDQPIRNGVKLNPCVVFNVTRQMRIYDEEIFGPCASVIVVDDEKAAVDTANDSAFGLSSSIFSRDVTKALSIAHNIVSGAVHINSGTFYDDHALPHGGTRDSGHGRFGGIWGLREFMYLKTVTIHGIGL
jgi:acyl-CoA reductase-like NAD-dependent aldehyde dehydrogenase